MTKQCRGRVVIISGHDYRTALRANMHPIADALRERRFEVCFISVGFSPVSRLQNDPRLPLWRRANRWEVVNGIQCYLWRTAFHPVRSDIKGVAALSLAMFESYPYLPSRFLDDAVRPAVAVIIESGLGILLIPKIRAANATASVIYLASDQLDTIGAHPILQSKLEQYSSLIDHICVPSPQMEEGFRWAPGRVYFVPHGLNPSEFVTNQPNPYSCNCNAVSVGSMLFDESFFDCASSQFPDVQFHIIGSGKPGQVRKNMRFYDRMPLHDTITYIKHASIGIAAYREAPGSQYLCDTSMKLMQYDQLGIVAVCPNFAAGGKPNRFGYVPGNPKSIYLAMKQGLETKHRTSTEQYLSWGEVVERLLRPMEFAGTRMRDANVAAVSVVDA